MSQAAKRKFRLPHLGMRIIKTGICVFFCLLLNYLFSAEVALVSSLAAIVSMQSTLENTMKTAIGRAGGTLLGGLAGMAMLPLAQSINVEGLYVVLMPIGMIVVIYLCVLLRIPGGVSICAYVYITVLVVPLGASSGNPYFSAMIRIADTAVGVLIALLVNRFIAPPKPKPFRDVEIPVNTFANVYNRVRDRLPGTEQLILVDTRLTDPDAVRTRPEMAETGISEAASKADSVAIPVPLNYASRPYIDAVFIGPGYSVLPFNLRQKDGYVTIPCESYPVSVAWHVEPETGKETYGLFRHEHKSDPEVHMIGGKPARVLRRSGKPVSGALRRVHHAPAAVDSSSAVKNPG